VSTHSLHKKGKIKNKESQAKKSHFANSLFFKELVKWQLMKIKQKTSIKFVEYIGLLYFENMLTLYIMAIKTLYKILLSTHSLHKD